MLHKYISPFLITICFALSLFLLSGCSKDQSASDSGYIAPDSISFEEYTSLLFQSEVTSDTLTLHYTLSQPEVYGIIDYKIALPDYSADARKQSALNIENISCGLQSYDYEVLTTEQKLTYDILNDYVSSNRSQSDYTYYPEILRPSTGFPAQLPVLLSEYHFYDRKDVEDYLTLLSLIPSCFDSVLDYETNKINEGLFLSDTQADTLIADLNTFCDNSSEHYLITTFRNKVAELSDLTAEEQASYCIENEGAFREYVLPAYEALRDFLVEHKGSGSNSAGLCYFPDGSDYYAALVYDATGSSHSIDELLEMTEKQRKSDLLAINGIAASHPGISLATDDFPMKDATPEEMLTCLSSAITKDFLPPVSTDFSVRSVDPCMQDSMAPAFYLTAPIDNISHNVIYINPRSHYEGFELFTTLAHEGFPGHLYQTTTTSASGCAPIRSILNYPGYVEGWATYVEMLSYSYAGLPEEKASLLMHNQSALLSLYATADLSIHAKGWTLSDLKDFLSDYGIDNKEAVSEIYDYIVAEPAHYLKYYIGCLEFLQLKDYAKETFGDSYSDKQFHQAVLSIGPAPFDIVKKYLKDYYRQTI